MVEATARRFALPLPPVTHRLAPELMVLYYILVVRLVLISMK